MKQKTPKPDRPRLSFRIVREPKDLARVFLHVPHSSNYIPPEFYENLNITKEQLEKYNEFYIDKDAKELFYIPKSCTKVFEFKYSRLFCDVERRLVNSKETMASIGEGFLYESCALLNEEPKKLHTKITREYKKKVIQIYKERQQTMYDAITENWTTDKLPAVFIDAHTFHDDLVMSTAQRLYRKIRREDIPDICIGFNDGDEHSNLFAYDIKEIFDQNHYKTCFNFPYQGCLVPKYNKKINKSKMAYVMIEINRRVYDDEKKFKQVQGVLKQIYVKLMRIYHGISSHFRL